MTQAKFNPRLDLARQDHERALAIQSGGLQVARQWFDYNKARRIVSHIKKHGVPAHWATVVEYKDGSGNLTLGLYRLDTFGCLAGFLPMCEKDYNLETAVCAEDARRLGMVMVIE